LASIFGDFWPKMAQKRLKKGQNPPVPVTFQLTMYFCIVFILCDLHDFYSWKSDNFTIGGVGVKAILAGFLPGIGLKKGLSQASERGRGRGRPRYSRPGGRRYFLRQCYFP
jgi:hypothetical protein